MAAITSLAIPDGGSAHVTAVVLDQNGVVMPGLIPTITDPGPDTTFTPDASTTGAGTVAGVTPGTDIVTATFAGISGALPVTVGPAPSVPTSIGFTTP